MPAYNPGEAINARSESLVNGTYPCDIYIVDDGSDVPVAEILDAFPRTKIIRLDKNAGVAARAERRPDGDPEAALRIRRPARCRRHFLPRSHRRTGRRSSISHPEHRRRRLLGPDSPRSNGRPSVHRAHAGRARSRSEQATAIYNRDHPTPDLHGPHRRAEGGRPLLRATIRLPKTTSSVRRISQQYPDCEHSGRVGRSRICRRPEVCRLRVGAASCSTVFIFNCAYFRPLEPKRVDRIGSKRSLLFLIPVGLRHRRSRNTGAT